MTQNSENIWDNLGKLFWIFIHMLSYAAWNQHCLALTIFDQCFLSAEDTSEIVIL